MLGDISEKMELMSEAIIEVIQDIDDVQNRLSVHSHTFWTFKASHF